MAYATLAYDVSGDVAADVRTDVAADARADVAYVLLYASSLVIEVQRIILLEIAKDTRTEE
jgi:Mn-containing catalase